jgi:flavorubredoxin
MTQQKKIVIPYYSASGHTQALAEAILEGVKSIHQNASLINISEITETDWEAFQSAEGIIFGSPTYMGSTIPYLSLPWRVQHTWVCILHFAVQDASPDPECFLN